jgi:hypothetical protein
MNSASERLEHSRYITGFLRWMILSPEGMISLFIPYQISCIDFTVTSCFGANVQPPHHRAVRKNGPGRMSPSDVSKRPEGLANYPFYGHA